MEFFRQEYWSGLPFPPSGDLPNPETEYESLASSAFLSTTQETLIHKKKCIYLALKEELPNPETESESLTSPAFLSTTQETLIHKKNAFT